MSFPSCREHTLLFQHAEWYFRWKFSVTFSSLPSLCLCPGHSPVVLPVLWNHTAQFSLPIHFSLGVFCLVFLPTRASLLENETVLLYHRGYTFSFYLRSLAVGLCKLPLGKISIISYQGMISHPLHHPNSPCCPNLSSCVLQITNCRPLTEFSGITHLEMAFDRQECHKMMHLSHFEAQQSRCKADTRTPWRDSDDLSRSAWK